MNEEWLKEKPIKTKDLLLDPNNPRFSKHFDEITPEERIADEKEQEEAYRRMNDPKNRFDIDELVNAILADGFIHVDKIFVRKINDKYLVVEGNRRITAIKKILRNYDNKTKGYDISDGLLKQISILPCIVLDSDTPNADEKIRKILGLRHHGSILTWRPLPAAFNLYSEYMQQLAREKGIDPKNPENFIYEPIIAKKIAAIYSVKPIRVREQVRVYRVYLQLLEASHRHPSVEESFSMIEETLSKEALTTFFKYDDKLSIFEDEGLDKILDLYFGLKEKPPVITEASAGKSNVRDFAYVVSEGKEEDIRRLVEDREKAGALAAEIETRISRQTIQSTFELVWEKLNGIDFGQIELDGFAPNEKESIIKIEAKIEQIKRAAKMK